MKQTGTQLWGPGWPSPCQAGPFLRPSEHVRGTCECPCWGGNQNRETRHFRVPRSLRRAGMSHNRDLDAPKWGLPDMRLGQTERMLTECAHTRTHAHKFYHHHLTAGHKGYDLRSDRRTDGRRHQSAPLLALGVRATAPCIGNRPRRAPWASTPGLAKPTPQRIRLVLSRPYSHLNWGGGGYDGPREPLTTKQPGRCECSRCKIGTPNDLVMGLQAQYGALGSA